MVAVQTDEIKHLDFTPVLPCEMPSHPTKHADLPATWVAELSCPCGTQGRVVVCEDGRARVATGRSRFVCRCGKSTVDAVEVVWSPISEKGQ